MQINITGKTIVTIASALFIGLTGWIASDYISLRDRVVKMETSVDTNLRQDSELAEVRATILDLVLLIKTEVNHDSHDHASDIEAVEPEMEEYRDFRVEQMDLESMLKDRGLDPSLKKRPDLKK